jgi:hypothetical protein
MPTCGQQSINPVARGKRERAIVGGYSPDVHRLPAELLSTGAIIGINEWGRDRYCDWWIACDTFRWYDWWQWMARMSAIRFMRKPNDTPRESQIPDSAADHWFEHVRDEIPTQWEGRLNWVSSTAMAAISLAIAMGYREVVLCGVDFVGKGRADGSEYPKEDFWASHMDGINCLLSRFQQHIRVYKTHPDSPLKCPLLEV